MIYSLIGAVINLASAARVFIHIPPAFGRMWELQMNSYHGNKANFVQKTNATV